MVKKLIVNLILDNLGRIGKSITSAYQQVVNSGGAQQSGFGKAAQATVGRFIVKPMTRTEACAILNIETSEPVEGQTAEEELKLDPKEIMDRFNVLMEKNQLEKGGSFYI